MTELQDFYDFLTERIQAGAQDRSPEDLVAEWREEQEVVRDVQEAFDDMAAGDTGIPLEEFLPALCAKHGLRPPALFTDGSVPRPGQFDVTVDD